MYCLALFPIFRSFVCVYSQFWWGSYCKYFGLPANWYRGNYCAISKLTHWGRVTHICVSKLTIIGSDNGLSPGRRQAIIWTNDGKLLIGPLGTNFSENVIEMYTFSFKKIHLKMSSAKWRSFVPASMWVTSSHTGQAKNFLKGFIPMKKRGNHICISNIMHVSSLRPISC